MLVVGMGMGMTWLNWVLIETLGSYLKLENNLFVYLFRRGCFFFGESRMLASSCF